MIFRQLFEPLSSTYTYLLGCEHTGQALLIDPVVNSIDRDLAELQRLGLTLAFTLDTHIHADHITGARHLKERVGSRIAAPETAWSSMRVTSSSRRRPLGKPSMFGMNSRPALVL